MGLLEKLFGKSEKRALTHESLFNVFRTGASAGVKVNENSALQCTAVWSCVRLIAESSASLPFLLYERLDRGKQRAQGHPVYTLLHDQANPDMTAMAFRSAMTAMAARSGNAYAEIERTNGGIPVALWPIRPGRVQPALNQDGRLYYLVDGQPVESDAIFHLKGFSLDGYVGLSPIEYARQAISLNIAAETFGAAFFQNGSNPGGYLKHPAKLSPEATKKLREQKEALHGGPSNAGRLAVLEEGMEWATFAIPNDQAQFLETRKFGVTEICRIFRVPPHLVCDLERATFSNIEQQSLEFITYCLSPWLNAWEQEVNVKLLSQAERGRYFAEHLVDGLLRGDIASRYSAYAIGRNNGWLSANDIRERENLNPVDGGDVYLVPLNMADMKDATPADDTDTPSEDDTTDTIAPAPAVRAAEIKAAHVGQLRALASRIIHKETAALRRAVGKEQFVETRDKFYTDHAAHVQEVLAPAVTALVGSLGDSRVSVLALDFTKKLAQDLVDESLREIRGAADVAAVLDRWEQSRADEIVERILEVDK